MGNRTPDLPACSVLWIKVVPHTTAPLAPRFYLNLAVIDFVRNVFEVYVSSVESVFVDCTSVVGCNGGVYTYNFVCYDHKQKVNDSKQ